MKIIITSILLLNVCFLRAQQSDKTIVPKSEVKVVNSQSVSYQIDSVMLAKKNQPQQESQKTVAYYDDYIKALEIKIASVKLDPKLSEEADKNGWFKQMDEYMKKAIYERSIVLNSK